MKASVSRLPTPLKTEPGLSYATAKRLDVTLTVNTSWMKSALAVMRMEGALVENFPLPLNVVVKTELPDEVRAVVMVTRVTNFIIIVDMSLG